MAKRAGMSESETATLAMHANTTATGTVLVLLIGALAQTLGSSFARALKSSIEAAGAGVGSRVESETAQEQYKKAMTAIASTLDKYC